MSQSAPSGGGSMTLYRQPLFAVDVLRNTRLKLLGVALKDWIVCSKCKHQQTYHCEEGGDFDRVCWRCGADHYHFVYFDELARSVTPTTVLYRMNRR